MGKDDMGDVAEEQFDRYLAEHAETMRARSMKSARTSSFISRSR